MWAWCIDRNLWVTATHIPGVLNAVADRRSREFKDETERQLDKAVFTQICHRYGLPDIDLFASRLNMQLPSFIFWALDPDAQVVDAFTLQWDQFFYAFTPFCLISRCLQK